MRHPSKFRLWYRFLRRRTRGLRRMCVSLLTIAMMVSSAVEKGLRFLETFTS